MVETHSMHSMHPFGSAVAADWQPPDWAGMFRCACINAVILSQSPLTMVLSMVSLMKSEAFRKAKDLDSTRREDVEPPTEAQQQKEFFQCTRQCRWKFGNTFDLTIVGGRSGWSNCQCFRHLVRERPPVVSRPQARHGVTAFRGADETLPQVIPRYSAKEFDTVNTWSGNETSGWNCDFVCVQQPDGSLTTLTKEEVQSQMLSADFRKLHCGRCAACSAPEDIEVLAKTRKWITEVMTTVAARFAAPWGHRDPKRLRTDLVEANISFSEKRYDGRTDLPSCMDVWADNIMCDAMSCKSKCWLKFFNAKNAKTDAWRNFNIELN
ncbi:unnamed protein product [Cladocopium goreaui]|uniref:Uncharacterized protein n=1 Tax=Cladocopium goreaui TaxID=2562237 RepID=A0A9P1CET7_9DINO|nr:unnamed protein product [Cladocopium goreaui]